MDIQICDTAEVTLTDEGLRILTETYARDIAPFPAQELVWDLDKDPTGKSHIFRCPLWELMRVFGPHFKMGTTGKYPFVGGNILVRESGRRKGYWVKVIDELRLVN